MTHRVFKRVYSEPALLYWLEKLDMPWESHFEDTEIDVARTIYQKGDIRSIEITPEGNAIINARIQDIDVYTIIDWHEERPHIRGSSESQLANRALAAAGLYEIEELIGEELPNVPLEAKAQPKEKTESIPTEKKPKKEETGRTLTICLRSEERGLVFEIFWEDENKTRTRALESTDQNDKNILHHEREQMIQLMHLVHKDSLHFVKNKHLYVLHDIERIPRFLKDSWPIWMRSFQTEEDETITLLKDGAHEAELVADIHGHGEGIGIDWILGYGETILTPEERDLLFRRRTSGIILPRRGIVRIKEEEQNLLSDWHEYSHKTGGSIPYYMLFSKFSQSVSKSIEGPEVAAWKTSLGDIKQDAKLPEFLRDYQSSGVHWLGHVCKHDCHPLLADEMGLGKTLQMLTLITQYPLKNKPHLIVCPASVVPVWKNEAARFYPELDIQILKKDHHFASYKEPCIWVGSYSQVRRKKDLLADISFGYTILDEAQMIKNLDAKTTQACMTIKAERRVALSGTPIENRHLDLWTIFRFLMPGLLGSRKDFESKLMRDGADAFSNLKTQLTPFVLRRTKQDVAKDLPDKAEMVTTCPLTEYQEEQYKRLCTESIENLSEDMSTNLSKDPMGVLSLLTRLRQICCDPAIIPGSESLDLEHSGKIKVLIDKLTEIVESGHKVVIFSQFVSFINRIHKAIEKAIPTLSIFELTGKTRDRDAPVRNFQENPHPSVLLVSLKAGGTGITLTAADYVFLMDPWWNPAAENQAIDRVHRIGQENPVFIYRMITPGTIEERIQKLKMRKQTMFDAVIGDMDNISHVTDYYDSLSELINLE